MNDNITKAQDIFIEYCSMLSEIVGLSNSMSQIVGFLYLNPGPVSIQEICKKLELTKGTVSLYLRNLEDRKVVKRAWINKKGRDKYYEINPDIWSDVLDNFLVIAKKRIELTDIAIDESKKALESNIDDLNETEKLEVKLLIERLETLADINNFTRTFISKNLNDFNEVTIKTQIKRINITD